MIDLNLNKDALANFAAEIPIGGPSSLSSLYDTLPAPSNPVGNINGANGNATSDTGTFVNNLLNLFDGGVKIFDSVVGRVQAVKQISKDSSAPYQPTVSPQQATFSLTPNQVQNVFIGVAGAALLLALVFSLKGK